MNNKNNEISTFKSVLSNLHQQDFHYQINYFFCGKVKVISEA